MASSDTGPDFQPLDQYTWLIAVGALAAFVFGYATGANDVANAFATSVGSKALTLKQAVVVAGIFEFLGALVLGRVSTSVIAGKIADINIFEEDVFGPPLYAYGMVCALAVGGLWQLWASWAGYNVSATQSIIGGIVGFSLVYGGTSAVNWADKEPANFPPYSGVLPIVLSWVICPVLTAIGAMIIFGTVRTVVLRHENSVSRAYWVLPFAVLLTAWLNVFFVLAKGAAKTLTEKHPDWDNTTFAWMAFVAGFGAMLLSLLLFPVIRKKVFEMEANDAAEAEAGTAKSVEGGEAKDVEAGDKAPVYEGGKLDSAGAPIGPAVRKAMGAPAAPEHEHATRAEALKDQLMKGVTYDIFEVIETDATISGIHARAEKFDKRAEFVFSYLQVFSAICVMFAHGAGEVGYMAGPLNAIYDVVKTGEVASKVDPKVWILVYTAGSLVIGLATYGYNVMRAMGTGIAMITPSRGFAAELATASIILMASQWGLPTSSSQAITGGIIGIGLLEGRKTGVNWVFIFKQFMAWVGTLLVVGLGTAGLYAQGVFSPAQNVGQYQV